jgi:hypothetical protein
MRRCSITAQFRSRRRCGRAAGRRAAVTGGRRRIPGSSLLASIDHIRMEMMQLSTTHQGMELTVVEPPGPPISLADLELGTWSAEQGTAFEAAEWVLGSLIAWCAAESAREQDPDRLAAIADECRKYAAIRRTLSVHEPQRVQRVLAEYGALARERYEALNSAS